MSDLHGDLEALIAEAHRQVEQQALEQEAEAATRADELLAEADEDARHTLDERAEHARSEADALGKRILALAEVEAKRAALRTREDLLDTVWRAAEARLRALPDDSERYLPVLRGLAGLAARTLASSEVELASEPRGRALLTPDRLGAWGREDGVAYRLAPEPLASFGGLEARAGRMRFDATFETRLAQAEQALRESTAERLLGAPREGRGAT